MEALQKRLEALEQQTQELKHQAQELKHHTQAVERRLRWWRRMAYGLGVLGVLALPLTSVRAQEGQSATTELQSATKELRMAPATEACRKGDPLAKQILSLLGMTRA